MNGSLIEIGVGVKASMDAGELMDTLADKHEVQRLLTTSCRVLHTLNDNELI